MEDYVNEHTGLLSAHEQRICNLERRMSGVEEMQRSLSELVTGVAVLAEQYRTISSDTRIIKERLTSIEAKPGKRWETAVGAIITTLIGLAIGYFITR